MLPEPPVVRKGPEPVAENAQQGRSDEQAGRPRKRYGMIAAIAGAVLLFLAIVGAVADMIIASATEVRGGRRLYGQTVPSEMPDKQLFTFRRPVAVAAIVTAGNFPVAVPSWYLVPALLCGNAVVWKPAEYTAACAEAFAQLIRRAGFPAGVFNLVLADGQTTFEGLDRALGEGVVDKVGFTGSTDVGRRIGELCGRHLQSPCLELGGKNPLVVMDDADLDLAVEGA